MTKARDPYWDAVKGIGIISIVIGHASWDVALTGIAGAAEITLHPGRFVYLYHIAIFLFCSGCLFKEPVSDLTGLIARKLKHLYLPYLAYSALYLLLRPLFLYMGIISGDLIDLPHAVIYLTNAITFNNGIGEMLSAIWFVPMLFFAEALFGAILFVTGRLFPSDRQRILREVCRILLLTVSGVAGLFAVEAQMNMLFSMQTVYLLLPVMGAGRYFRLLTERVARGKKQDSKEQSTGKQTVRRSSVMDSRILNLPCMILVIVLMLEIVALPNGELNLSAYRIISKTLFFPATAVGIYFALCLAKYLMKVPGIRKILTASGRHSFDIMAMHFLAFKIVDLIVCRATGNLAEMAKFTRTYDNLWPIYYIAGVALPLLARRIWNLAAAKLPHAFASASASDPGGVKQ